MTDAPHRAPRKKRTRMAGAGCFVQGLGLLVFGASLIFMSVPAAVIGFLLMAVLLVAGSSMSRYWSCGRCGTQIAGRDVTVCPGCRAELF